MNEIKWISDYDFDKVPDGPVMLGTGFCSAVAVMFTSIAWVVQPAMWELWFVPLVIAWVVVGILFLTNGPRQLSGSRRNLYDRYRGLPGELKKDVGSLTCQEIMAMTQNDATMLYSKLGTLYDTWAKTMDARNTKVEALVENIEHAKSVYAELRELS